MFGMLPVSLRAAVGYRLEFPNSGPEGFRYRLIPVHLRLCGGIGAP
jgi:hypothetical protein